MFAIKLDGTSPSFTIPLVSGAADLLASAAAEPNFIDYSKLTLASVSASIYGLSNPLTCVVDPFGDSITISGVSGLSGSYSFTLAFTYDLPA